MLFPLEQTKFVPFTLCDLPIGILIELKSAMDLRKKWLGWICERKAANFLKKNNYKIINRNHRTKIGEIDLIAEKNSEIVFIEVKSLTHSDSFSPEDHFDWKKQKKQILLGNQYLSTLREERSARFDLITVVKKEGDYFIEHYENVIEET